MNWKPIFTAPKDGSRVLTFRDGFRDSMAVGWYSTNLDQWISVSGFNWLCPTHWMPLPEPPQ